MFSFLKKKPKKVRVRPSKGDTIDDVARKMVDIANDRDINVWCTFEGTLFVIVPGTSLEDAIHLWHSARVGGLVYKF